MEKIVINQNVLKTIAECYKDPEIVSIPLPREMIKVKKILNVEKTIEKSKTIKEPFRLPGNIIIVFSVILLPFAHNHSGTNGIIFSVSMLVIGMIFSIFLKKNKTISTQEKIIVPEEFEFEEPEQQRYEETRKFSNKKINKFGKTKVYFSVIEVAGKKIMLIEDCGIEKELSLQTIKNPLKFIRNLQNEAKILDEIPDILNGDKIDFEISENTNYGKKVPLRGFEKDIIEFLIDSENTLRDKKKMKIEIPVIIDKGLAKHLSPCKNGKQFSITNEILRVVDGENGEQLENALNLWKENISRKIDKINDIRIYSLDKELSTEFLMLGQTSHFSSFNFYCPSCNKEVSDELLGRDYSVQNTVINETIHFSKNTRCNYLPDKNIWKCPVCSDNTQSPIPIHKTLDEILTPTYDKLMEEHKVERDKKYSETRNKELEYRKELKTRVDQVNFENFNQIMSLEDEMEKMKLEVIGQKEAIDYMNKVAFEFRKISTDLLAKIQEETKEIEVKVSNRAKDITNMLQVFTKEQLGSYSQEMNELSKAKRINEEIRDNRLKEIVMATKEAGEKVYGAVKENTAVTRESGEKIFSAVKENTAVTRETGEKVVGAVKENTEVSRKGMSEIVKSNQENKEQLKKNYALNSAVAKQQGHKVDDYAFWRIDKHIGGALSNMKTSVKGGSSVEREMSNN